MKGTHAINDIGSSLDAGNHHGGGFSSFLELWLVGWQAAKAQPSFQDGGGNRLLDFVGQGSNLGFLPKQSPDMHRAQPEPAHFLLELNVFEQNLFKRSGFDRPKSVHSLSGPTHFLKVLPIARDLTLDR